MADTSVGRPVTVKSIHPSNGYLCRQELETWDAFTNTFEPLTGATVTATIARDAAGTLPVTGIVDIALPEIGTPGVYATVLSGVLTSALVPYIGQIVYQIVRDSVTNDLLTVTPLMVAWPRYAQ